jgi:hypothetical protein
VYKKKYNIYNEKKKIKVRQAYLFKTPQYLVSNNTYTPLMIYNHNRVVKTKKKRPRPKERKR